MNGPTLQDILDAKSKRMQHRIQMQSEYAGPCIVASINMPGPVKDSARVRALFHYAVNKIFSNFTVITSSCLLEKTGPHGIFVVSGDPVAIKQAACQLESEKCYGRLLDIDVYDASGNPVVAASRKAGRACFLCQNPAAICMREQRHSAHDILQAVDELFFVFHADMSRQISPLAEKYYTVALEAILYEVASFPSPGLVDPIHNGSHDDMDFFTFLRSSAAISLGLARCIEAGIRHDGAPASLLPVLRIIGQEAEKRMLCATKGVNTQKGILFSLGLVLGAVGILLHDARQISPESIRDVVQQMTSGIVVREMETETPATAGQRAYKSFGIAGIRGEMERGMPSVFTAGLPALERGLADGNTKNHAFIRALLSLIAVVDDTTILARSGRIESLRMIQKKAHDLVQSGALDSADWREAVWKFDSLLVQQNISPGGSADLLALTWFLHCMKNDAPLPDEPG